MIFSTNFLRNLLFSSTLRARIHRQFINIVYILKFSHKTFSFFEMSLSNFSDKFSLCIDHIRSSILAMRGVVVARA